ncbi:MAG: CoA transferase [Chloroflexi bacterium]|nr:CoA transferase [Chloroflexota bacterium]
MSKGLLASYRVLDLGTAFAGSIPGHLLADMGCEVIKVEARQRFDPLRYGPGAVRKDKARTKEEADQECNAWFHTFNRAKLGVTLDFTVPEGREVFLDLVRCSDAIIENFTPDVLTKFNLDHPALRRAKPDVVLCSLSVAGAHGPLRDTRAYASSIVAMSGIDSVMGHGDRPEPVDPPNAHGDFNAGIFGAFSVLAALVHRNRTGQGQWLDLSAWESTSVFLMEGIMDYTMNGRIAGPQGNTHPTMAPHGAYPTKSDEAARDADGDKWASIACTTEEEWRGLCQAMGDPPWTKEERFADKHQRMKHRKELDQRIGEWTRQHTHYEVMEACQKHGVAAMPVLNTEEQLHDPHLRARRTHLEVEHFLLGKELLYRAPWNVGGVLPGVARPSPRLGEHNDYIYNQLLAMTKSEMARLHEVGVA